MNFGSKIKKSKIFSKIKGTDKLISTHIIFGEFKKVTLLLIKRIVDYYKKMKNI